jgi:hypothetical protein
MRSSARSHSRSGCALDSSGRGRRRRSSAPSAREMVAPSSA